MSKKQQKSEQHYRNDIVKKMRALSVYHVEFSHTIDTLARTLYDYDRTLKSFEDSGGNVVIKHTNKVTGFVGGAKNRPAPISEAEVMKIVNQMQEGTDKPRHKVEFVVGEFVRVKEGPFTDFNGSVEDVNYEKSKVRVSVTIFGRSTPVELEFSQIEKT